MNTTRHLIASRSRNGWAANVELDRHSEHAGVGTARRCAAMVAAVTGRAGRQSDLVDLSRTSDT